MTRAAIGGGTLGHLGVTRLVQLPTGWLWKPALRLATQVVTLLAKATISFVKLPSGLLSWRSLAKLEGNQV